MMDGKLLFRGRTWWPQEFAVCMAMDAFRLCLFGKPSNFTKREVIEWIETAGKDA
jgi:hypothetical protein